MAKNDIIASMGLDISDVREGLEKAETSVGKFAQGAKGNMLALAGGTAIAASAIYSYAESGQDAFRNLVKGGNDFAESLAQVSKSGTIEGIVSELEKVKTKSAEIDNGIKALTEGLGGYFGTIRANVGLLFGGTGAQDQIKEIGETQDRVNEQAMRARQSMIALTEREIAISKMRIAGENEAAEAAEEQLKAEREIARIQSQSTDAYVKNKQIESQAAKRLADQVIKAAEDEKKLREFERKQKEDFRKQEEQDAKKAEDEASKLRDFERKQVEDFKRFESEKSKKAIEEQSKIDSEIKRANDELVREEERGVDFQNSKLSIADRLALANQKVADAEKQVSKETKGTLGWYKEMAKLQSARNDAQELFSQRAANYGKSFSQGRRADREMKKEVKRQQRGERRLREAEARKGQEVRGAASGLGNQQQRGNNIQPKGPAAAPMPAQAGNEMTVAVLKVGKLEPK